MTADEWNAAVPEGSIVHYAPGDGRVVMGTTEGRASMLSSGLHGVRVRFTPSYVEFILLSHLYPARSEA